MFFVTSWHRIRAALRPSASLGFVVAVTSMFAAMITERRTRLRQALVTGGITTGGALGFALWTVLTERRVWRFRTRKGKSPGMAPPPPAGQLPTLQTLLGVVPVAQTQIRAGDAATITSVNTYTDGFRVRAEFRFGTSVVYPIPPTMRQRRKDVRIPRFDLYAADDCGNRYHPWYPSASGGGTRWTSNAIFSPPLAVDAHTLSVEIAELRWEKMSDSISLFDAFADTLDRPTKWRFVIPLAGTATTRNASDPIAG